MGAVEDFKRVLEVCVLFWLMLTSFATVVCTPSTAWYVVQVFDTLICHVNYNNQRATHLHLSFPFRSATVARMARATAFVEDLRRVPEVCSVQSQFFVSGLRNAMGARALKRSASSVGRLAMLCEVDAASVAEMKGR